METTNVAYETKLGNGSEMTSYMATGLAEGFEQSSDVRDTIRAWSFLIGTGLCYQLQGWFGRTAQNVISSGVMDSHGVVDWELVEERLDSSSNDDDDDDDDDE